MRLAGGLMGRAGDDTAAVFEVRGEHAVVSGEMGAGAWHEGGEAGDKVDGVEYDMRNLSTTLRHRRLRFTEQSLLLWMWQVG